MSLKFSIDFHSFPFNAFKRAKHCHDEIDLAALATQQTDTS